MYKVKLTALCDNAEKLLGDLEVQGVLPELPYPDKLPLGLFVKGKRPIDLGVVLEVSLNNLFKTFETTKGKFIIEKL